MRRTQPAFVRLADEMACAEGYHVIDPRLDALGDEGLM
jgi:hypothetical protein